MPISSPGAGTASRARRSRYIPALDGLRTLAVAAVVLYHLNPMLAPGGMQGVTIFFVLSGYLITRLLLIEISNTGTIDLKDFWKRRLRRLIPAIVTVIVVTAALCTGLNHVMLTKMRPDIIPSALFLNNWWQIFNQQSYFNAVGGPSPLTHFWSLAIEMQFYLVWPVALMLARRAGQPRTRVRRMVFALAIVSAVEMAVLYNPAVDPSRVYYGTDTRAFSLLLGAWLAFVPLRRVDLWLRAKVLHEHVVPAVSAAVGDGVHGAGGGPYARPANARRTPGAPGYSALDILGVVGLVGTIVLIVFTNGYTAFPYRGGILLASVFAMMLVAACAQPTSLLAKLFALKPLVWLGQRSYSIYLWHYPLLLLMNPAADVTAKPWWALVLQAAVVVAVSALCYHVIETPFRHGAFGRLVSLAKELRKGPKAPELQELKRVKPQLVAAAAGTAAVCLVALGGIALVPDTSALSEEGQQLLQGGKEGEGASAGIQETPADPTVLNEAGFPEGSYDITMIGDSVSLRTVEAFPSVFPHGHIDAAINRQFIAGSQIYQGLLDQNLAGRVAVFALGTNGAFTSGDIDRILELAGDKRIVVFVTNRCGNAWCIPNNQLMFDAAERYENVRVVDWYTHSAGRNELFDGDGIHLSNAGVNEFLGLIKNEVSKYLPVHLEDGTDERILAAQQVIDAMKSALNVTPAKVTPEDLGQQG